MVQGEKGSVYCERKKRQIKYVYYPVMNTIISTKAIAKGHVKFYRINKRSIKIKLKGHLLLPECRYIYDSYKLGASK